MSRILSFFFLGGGGKGVGKSDWNYCSNTKTGQFCTIYGNSYRFQHPKLPPVHATALGDMSNRLWKIIQYQLYSGHMLSPQPFSWSKNLLNKTLILIFGNELVPIENWSSGSFGHPITVGTWVHVSNRYEILCYFKNMHEISFFCSSPTFPVVSEAVHCQLILGKEPEEIPLHGSTPNAPDSICESVVTQLVLNYHTPFHVQFDSKFINTLPLWVKWNI